MHIKKQRLLTAGPTPLYPKALQAMMGADLHHRTQEFRDVVLSVLAGLKTALGTTNDVVILTASGTGAMEASVPNCFSPGDRVVVCSAGKFGERWLEMTKAYGLDVVPLTAPYGKSVEAEAVAHALAANPDVKGVFVQASESSTGAAHDVQAMGQAIRSGAPAALFIVDAITGIGTMPLEIDAWGLDLVLGGSQKAFMSSARSRVPIGEPEGVGAHGDRPASALLFRPAAREEKRSTGRILVDSRDVAHSRLGRSVEVHRNPRIG